MKKMIISACMLTALATTTYAKGNENTGSNTVAMVTDDNKTQVDPAALPDAVKATLGTDVYNSWTVASAWLIKTDAGAYYSVQLTKDDKTNTVNIDKAGNVK